MLSRSSHGVPVLIEVIVVQLHARRILPADSVDSRAFMFLSQHRGPFCPICELATDPETLTTEDVKTVRGGILMEKYCTACSSRWHEWYRYIFTADVPTLPQD